MAQMNAAAVASITLEAVQEIIPDLVETDDTFDGLITDNGRAIRISPRGYRIPLKYAKPGSYSAGNLDGAALPRGGGISLDNGSLTPQTLMLPVEWTKLVELIGKKVDKVAVENVVDTTLADAADNLKTIRDILLQTDGTGNLGTISGTVTSKVVNMTPSGFGARLLRPGQKVDVYNGASQRTNPTVTVTAASWTNFLGGTQQFTYTETDPTSIGNGDIIRVTGLTSGAPVFIYGLPYFHSTSTSGTLLGINRTNPYVVSNGYSLGGAQISLPALRLLLNQVKNRLGVKALKGQFWQVHSSQLAAYEELGFERQNYDISMKAEYPDMLFQGKARVGGFPVVENIHADNSVWDFVAPKCWGKVKYGDGTFWYEIPGIGRIYPIYDTTTGAPDTAFGATLVDPLQYFCDNVLAGGRVSSCKTPAGN